MDNVIIAIIVLLHVHEKLVFFQFFSAYIVSRFILPHTLAN